MTLSPMRRMQPHFLRALCTLLAFDLVFPSHSLALRAPQIKNDSPALSGLEESLVDPPGETDPERQALRWKEFILKTYDTLNGFHGSWLDKLWVGFLVKKPREKVPVRLEGGLPRGVLGGVHVPLVRLFEQLNDLTPKIAEEEYRTAKEVLNLRIHALEEIQAEVSRALARVQEPERQRELLHLRNGTVAEYQWALANFKGLLESWRDRFDQLVAGPLAPAEAGLEEDLPKVETIGSDLTLPEALRLFERKVGAGWVADHRTGLRSMIDASPEMSAVLLEQSLPALIDSYGLPWVESRWADLVELAENAGESGFHLFGQGLPRLRGAFGQEWVELHWPQLVRMGTSAKQDAGMLFELVPPVLKEVITPEGLPGLGADLLRLIHAVKRRQSTLAPGFEALIRSFGGPWVAQHWSALVAMGLKTGPSMAEAYSALASLKALVEARGLAEVADEFTQAAERAKPGGLAFFEGLSRLTEELGTEWVQANWDWLRRWMVEAGEWAGPAAGVLAAMKPALTPQNLQTLSNGAIRMARAQGEEAFQPGQLGSSLKRVRESFGAAWTLEHWEDLAELAELAGKYVGKGYQALASWGPKDPKRFGWLSAHWLDLLELSRSAGGDWPALLSIGFPGLLRGFSGRWVDRNWADLMALGRLAGGRAFVLFAETLPFLQAAYGLGSWSGTLANLFKLHWTGLRWSVVREGLRLVLRRTTDHNRERILHLLFSQEHLGWLKSQRADLRLHWDFYAQVLSQESRLAYQILEGVLEGMKSGAVDPQLPPTERKAVLDYAAKFHAFTPVLFQIYKRGGEESLEPLRQFAGKIPKDGIGPEEIRQLTDRYEAEGLNGQEVTMAAVQTVIPASGASFLAKSEILWHLEWSRKIGDLRGQIPAPLKDRPLGGSDEQNTLIVREWVLKKGERFDPDRRIGDLLDEMRFRDQGFPPEEIMARAQRDRERLKEALVLYFFSRAPPDRQAALQVFLEYARHSDRLGEKVDRIQPDDYAGLNLLEQLFVEEDNLSLVLKEVLQEFDPTQLPYVSLEAPRPVSNARALSQQIGAVWRGARLGPEDKQARIAQILQGLSTKSVEENLAPLLDAELGLVVLRASRQQRLGRPMTLSEIVDDLFQEPLERVRAEKGKFEPKELEQRIVLEFRVVKGIPFGLWGDNSGVCVAANWDLWKDPRFLILAIFDKVQGRLMGSAHLFEVEIGGKKVLTVPGINPSVELLSQVKARDVYPLVERALLEVAEKGGYDALYIPTKTVILSNRPDLSKEVQKRYGNRRLRLADPVEWSTRPSYPFQEVYVVWTRTAAAGLEEGTAGWRGDGVEQWRAFRGTTAFQLLRFLEWRRDMLRIAQLEGNGNGEAPDAAGWFSREQAERLLREAPDQFLLVDNRHRQLGLLGRGNGELYHELGSRSLSNIVVVPLTQELVTRHEDRFEYLLGQLGIWLGDRVERYLRNRDLKAEYSFAAMDPLTHEVLGFISANRGDARRERPDSSSVYVGWNVVDKSRRSSGVGRLLLEAALRAAYQVPEIHRVYLDSLTRSETQRFYGLLGAQRARTSRGILDSSGNRVRYQFILRTPEEVQAQVEQAGLEELDRQIGNLQAGRPEARVKAADWIRQQTPEALLPRAEELSRAVVANLEYVYSPRLAWIQRLLFGSADKRQVAARAAAWRAMVSMADEEALLPALLSASQEFLKQALDRAVSEARPEEGSALELFSIFLPLKQFHPALAAQTGFLIQHLRYPRPEIRALAQKVLISYIHLAHGVDLKTLRPAVPRFIINLTDKSAEVKEGARSAVLAAAGVQPLQDELWKQFPALVEGAAGSEDWELVELLKELGPRPEFRRRMTKSVLALILQLRTADADKAENIQNFVGRITGRKEFESLGRALAPTLVAVMRDASAPGFVAAVWLISHLLEGGVPPVLVGAVHLLVERLAYAPGAEAEGEQVASVVKGLLHMISGSPQVAQALKQELPLIVSYLDHPVPNVRYITYDLLSVLMDGDVADPVMIAQALEAHLGDLEDSSAFIRGGFQALLVSYLHYLKMESRLLLPTAQSAAAVQSLQHMRQSVLPAVSERVVRNLSYPAGFVRLTALQAVAALVGSGLSTSAAQFKAAAPVIKSLKAKDEKERLAAYQALVALAGPLDNLPGLAKAVPAAVQELQNAPRWGWNDDDIELMELAREFLSILLQEEKLRGLMEVHGVTPALLGFPAGVTLEQAAQFRLLWHGVQDSVGNGTAYRRLSLGARAQLRWQMIRGIRLYSVQELFPLADRLTAHYARLEALDRALGLPSVGAELHLQKDKEEMKKIARLARALSTGVGSHGLRPVQEERGDQLDFRMLPAYPSTFRFLLGSALEAPEFDTHPVIGAHYTVGVDLGKSLAPIILALFYSDTLYPWLPTPAGSSDVGFPGVYTYQGATLDPRTGEQTDQNQSNLHLRPLRVLEERSIGEGEVMVQPLNLFQEDLERIAWFSVGATAPAGSPAAAAYAEFERNWDAWVADLESPDIRELLEEAKRRYGKVSGLMRPHALDLASRDIYRALYGVAPENVAASKSKVPSPKQVERALPVQRALAGYVEAAIRRIQEARMPGKDVVEALQAYRRAETLEEMDQAYEGAVAQMRQALSSGEFPVGSAEQTQLLKLAAVLGAAGPSAELGAGLEESTDGAMSKLDQQAFQELEKLLLNPGVPRRVPVTVEEVTPGGARVVYRSEGGGTAQGFLPVGTTFLDDEHFVSIEAKLTWLGQRARLAEPLEVFPEGIGHSRRDDAPLMIFRMDRLVGPDLFEEEPVFHDQIIASNEAGRIRLFLSWLAEQGSEPTERLIQMYYLGAWGRLRPGQAAEVIEWLAKNVRPGQGRALFLLFHDLVRSSQTTNRGRIEWWRAQEDALRGVAAAAPFAGPKAEVLEAIQGLWTLVDKNWPEETRPQALSHLRYAAQRLGTNQALAWLRLVSPDGQGAGLEEVKRYESVQAFLEAYAEDLRASGTLPLVETIRREKKELPIEVLVIPAMAVVPMTIQVYVMAEDPSEQAEWEVALQERLNREGDRLQQTLFLVRPFPADGRIEGGSPAIVIRQAGAILPVPEKGLRLPVVTLSILNEIEQLHPSWLYALAVNRALDGLRIGPVLEVIPVEDGFAFFV